MQQLKFFWGGGENNSINNHFLKIKFVYWMTTTLTLENGCLGPGSHLRAGTVRAEQWRALTSSERPGSVRAYPWRWAILSLFFLNAIFGNTWNAETAALITGTNTRVMWERQVRDTWGRAWARRQNGGRLKKTRSSLSFARVHFLLFFFPSSSSSAVGLHLSVRTANY